LSHHLPKGFVFILAMLTSITPLAIDAYLPSFPTIAQEYDTSIDRIEITLSIYLIGFALGQLLGGPLSDRYGRKRFIYGGLGVYILFSFLIAASHSVEMLWICRFFQALGGGFAVVNTNAIVRDCFHGKEGARVFSIISMIMMVAPMLAPAIGATLLKLSSWHTIFIFLGLYALTLIYFITHLPETSPKSRSQKLLANYFVILRRLSAVILILTSGFAVSGMFVFITKASFIYMEYFQITPDYFILFFGLNVITIMFTSRLNIALLRYRSPLQLFTYGIMLQWSTGALLYLIGTGGYLYAVVALLMLFVGSLGLVFGNAIALLLEHFPSMSATANALNGVTGFMLAALMGFIASQLHDDTLYPVFAVMWSTSSLSILFLILLRKILAQEYPND
jgi:DHA1 family bicyclomycin/chloramphenicol resistance-like MFS transporter